MPSPPRSSVSFPSQADLFYFCTTSSTSEEDLNIHYAPPSRSSLRIGVVTFGHEQVQLLDLAALDLLAMVGKNRISKLSSTALAIDQAVDEIDIRYVSVTGEGSFPVTAGTRMPVTNSFANAPQFDIVVIPGSFSLSKLPTEASSFLTSQCLNPNLVAILSIGSGISHLVQAGSLHGTRAAAPRSLLPTLQQRFPETQWQYSPWARHGKVWTSNSAISALDMVSAWMREYFWDRIEAVECAVTAAGLGSLYDYNHCDY
ncbi:dj-1 family protein [Stemphylium lycopersici]|uniref:Dj-1 family protein n=1 Tax=Stemphylium lycopersici TaxID=183478 RepID=A0A364NBW6_STELY|nr:dj-1 family protein [Stemphylium lycopersici]